MLTDKSWLVLLYLGLVLAVCGLPFLTLLRLQLPFGRFALALFCAGLVAGAMALLTARGIPATRSPGLLSFILVLPLRRLGVSAVISGLAGC
jgi:hypothetical protein